MNQNLLTSMQQILSQKGLGKEILVEAIEAALLQAARRRFGLEASVEVGLDEETGEISIAAPKRVVEIMRTYATEIPIEEAVKMHPEALVGELVQVPVRTEDLGRIEAQLARQILVQKIKDAERANIFGLYKDRVEEIVSGVVQQEDYRDIIMEIEGAEAVLPLKEQLRNERYRRGDRMRALIIDVLDPDDEERIGRRPKAPVILSRAEPVFLVRLFEQEVPEIADELVQIEAVAREAGERSKIAVATTEDGIDPVGTCVGVRGSRVQMVMQELNGERIDVIEWSSDPKRFVANALSPVKDITDVVFEEDEDGEQVAIVVVPDEALSLAIGRRGQNARLASRLTGCQIDIVGEREAGEALRSQVEAEVFKSDEEVIDEDTVERDPAEAPVEELLGVTPKLAVTLRENGYETIGAIALADPTALAELPNLGMKTSEKLVQSAQHAAPAAGVEDEAQADAEDASPAEETEATDGDAGVAVDDEAAEATDDEAEVVDDVAADNDDAETPLDEE
jgi:N utilization substance protein A